MPNHVRKPSLNNAEAFAEKLAFEMEASAAAQVFLEFSLEISGLSSGAVFLAEMETGAIVACPASKGTAVSEIEKAKLEEICRTQKPKRCRSKDRSHWCVTIPLVHENHGLGCLFLSGSVEKKQRSRLLEVVAEYSRYVWRSLPKSKIDDPAVEETRKLMHDFRNIVAGLSGYAQLLQRQAIALDPKNVEQYASIIEREAQRLARMAEQYLHSSRGVKELDRSHKHIPAEVIGEVHALMAADLNQHGIHLLIRIESEKNLYIDSDLLQRALLNLLVNAKEALPHGGIIELAAEQNAGQIDFRVSDSGPGIAPQIAEKIFREPVSHGKNKGCGLGLSIVKEVADVFGGNVRIESSPFGGASIVLSLPE